MKRLLECPIPLGEVTPSVGAMLRERAAALGARVAYRERLHGHEYEARTFRGLYDEVARVGAGLARRGLGKGDTIATLSRNRREMLVVEAAAMGIGAVATPIFSEYPSGPLDYVLRHCGARLLVVSDAAHLREALGAPAARELDRIFVMDIPPEGLPAGGPAIQPFGELLESPDTRSFEESSAGVLPDDPCLLMYTSGTTGKPKGVLLCHRNILSQRRAIELLWKLGPDDRFLSYLPWHHSFGGIFELFGALYSGAALTLDDSYGKDIGLLIENFKRVKPTVYFSVPRIHQVLVAEAKKSKELERAIFHPDLKFVFTAAAPLATSVAEYFEAKGVPVVEGWGLTETSPCVTLTPLSGKRPRGVVGKPLPGIQIRIAEDGEILVRGPNVMLGYYKDPERNARVLDPDGWFHTGDFGAIVDDCLALKGRMDGMFKLSSGQMVISQSVETALCSSPYIEYAIVFGRGEDFVGAVVFPNPRNLPKDCGPLRRDKLRELLKVEVQRASRAIPEKYQRPKAFVVAGEEPSLVNGELTPTLKVVKPRVLSNYAAYVKAIFKPDEAAPGIRMEVVRIP